MKLIANKKILISNKKKISKDQKYYLKHRVKLLQKLTEPVLCGCGQTTTKSNYYNHIKSKRHKQLLQQECKQNYEYCEECKTYVQNMFIHVRSKKHIRKKT